MSSLLQILFGLLIPVKLNIVSSLSLLFRITLLFRTTKWFTSIHNSHWNRSFSFQYCFKNVLCVLSFNVNLISVVKIVQDANCVVVFDVDCCLLQNQSLKKAIEAGRLHNGLFVVKPFLDTPKCSQVTFSSNPTFWHQCLGHPS